MIALLLQSRLVRWLGAAVMGALAVLTFGMVKRREGVTDERAKQAQRDAAAYTEAVERVLDEKPSDDPADVIRQRMRDRANRKP